MRVILITYLLFSYFLSFSQDTITKSKEKKFQVAIITGGYYKYFFGKRYIEPKPTNPGDDFTLHQYERFTKIPTQGFQVGVLLSLKVYRNLFLKSGLSFCNRKIIYENNQDTVIKYGYFPYALGNMRNIHKGHHKAE